MTETASRATATTGTIYRLVDPRDHETRYIGQTVRPLTVRLSGHYGKSNKSPKVRAWVAELKASGLRPMIEPVSENVPAGQLLAAERAEITRLILAGGSLLNELSTAEGRELARQRDEREREAARKCGWRELAAVAMDVLGGPVPPGAIPGVSVIPPEAWQSWYEVRPDRLQHCEVLGQVLRAHPSTSSWEFLDRRQQEAARRLWWSAQGAWGEVRGIGPDAFDRKLHDHFAATVALPDLSAEEVSRLLVLTVWYMVAVQPWRHLAELAGLSLDDPSFIAWAGASDSGVREGLRSLASADPRLLARLSMRWDGGPYEKGSGEYLGIVAAAYSGVTPAGALRSVMTEVLGKCARDHQMTQPMADLLMRIDERALDSALGKDFAAEVDAELGLASGTAGRVLRALLDPDRLGHTSDRSLQRAADRASQTFPVTDLPDYGGWEGYGVIGARAVGACLVRARLGESKWKPSDEYMAHHRALWVPQDRA